jgi:hypothetical protein
MISTITPWIRNGCWDWVVGTTFRNDNNTLHKGEGKMDALRRNGYFERCPHLAVPQMTRNIK